MEQESATTINRTSFDDLTLEIHAWIALFLTPHDLDVCVRVSQAWRMLFHPYLWRHADIKWNYDEYWEYEIAYGMEVNSSLIHSLRLRAFHHNMTEFLECCPRTFPHLTSAVFEDVKWWSDEEVAQFIRLSSAGWKRLVFQAIRKDFDSYVLFESKSFEALLPHVGPTLEIVRFDTASSISGSQIDRLLCSAPKLKQAYFSGYYADMDGGWMDARGIVDSKWVCLNLEVFGCRIGNIPRPDITRVLPWESPEPAYGTHLESVTLQRRIYSKLARLTKLRELRLGYMIDTRTLDFLPGDREYWRQYACLAMTLESGLDLLQGLQELKVVGLEDMEVYIGESERRWFKKHWPNARIQVAGYKDCDRMEIL
ncbi:hypothetical protein BGZ91_008745 [Linnemannia elongata]|nr:hypothetical protein BGZ91_008745 [Linnemannia elongata]